MVDIPHTARAAVLYSFGEDYVIEDNYPVKQPEDLAPGECLVKVEYSGLCHSDIDVKAGLHPPAKLPLIGGHEGVGTIVAIGQSTVNSPVKVGDRVGCKWTATSCLHCEVCEKGVDACCLNSKQHGFTTDGTFSEYMVGWTHHVSPIPPALDSASAASILCAGVTIYTALKNSSTHVGNWVAIAGAGGGLGHLGIQYAVAMGLRVVAIDTGDDKKELCLKLGAEKWVDFRESGENLIADVQAAADGLGPHAAIVAASGSSVPYEQALRYLRITGRLVAVGFPEGGGVMKAPASLFIQRALSVVGSAVGSRQDAIEALDLAARGKVKVHYQLKELKELNQVASDMAAYKIAGRIVVKI